jgi:hypothetical protein
MRNSSLAIGIDVIKSALKQQPGFQVEKIEFVPPDRMLLNLAISQSVLRRNAILYPNAVIQLAVVAGRLRLEIVNINLFGVTVPPLLIRQQLQQFVRVPEDEANSVIQKVVERTGLRLGAISLTADTLVLTFEG